jgi:hypothetical protein
VAVAPDILEDAEYELALRVLRRKKAMEHPAFMLQFTHCIDAKTGEDFDFDLLTADERALIDLPGEPGPWHWHRDLLESWMGQVISLEYKARQLGITWLAAAYGLWIVLAKPGSRVLIVSINQEGEAPRFGYTAAQVAGSHNTAYNIFKAHAPGARRHPSQDIEWASIGRTALRDSRAPVDAKAARRDGGARDPGRVRLRGLRPPDLRSACFPIIDGGGCAIIVSTANGVSTVDGEGEAAGSFFHISVERRLDGDRPPFPRRLTHPDRDEDWYRLRARSLPPSDRAGSIRHAGGASSSPVAAGSTWTS